MEDERKLLSFNQATSVIWEVCVCMRVLFLVSLSVCVLEWLDHALTRSLPSRFPNVLYCSLPIPLMHTEISWLCYHQCPSSGGVMILHPLKPQH